MTNPPLVFEKLSMPLSQRCFTRPRVLSLLGTSLTTCTSTILSARAGTGKTTLAADFAQQCGRRVCWYKVDAPDGDPKIFFAYLTASIRRHRPQFGSPCWNQLLATCKDEDATVLAESLIYELLESGNKPLLIVIEDLHLVCDSGWVMPFVRRSLPLLPPEGHVLITSRTMPPAPMWRMRSKQTLTVLDEESLNFNRQEAIEFFEGHGHSAEEACIAFDHSHGRAAALVNFATTLESALTKRKRDDGSRLLGECWATAHE